VRELGLEEDVALPGFVDNPYKYMKRAAVFVLSSRWEGFGIVLVEAMALGTPVIATDCPSGPAEILEDGRWGRLVPVGDVHRLAEAILRVLKEEKIDTSVVRASMFSVERILEDYANILGIKI
jgi:glycosyltransferase involved in cell wall biosynthesis